MGKCLDCEYKDLPSTSAICWECEKSGIMCNHTPEKQSPKPRPIRVRIEMNGMDPMRSKIQNADTGAPLQGVTEAVIKMTPDGCAARLTLNDFDMVFTGEAIAVPAKK